MSVLHAKTLEWEARLRKEGYEVITTWDHIYKKERPLSLPAKMKWS